MHDLDVSGSLATEAPKSQMYELYGFVDHYGIMGGGHYTATVKHALSNQWYVFDDETFEYSSLSM